MALKDIVRTDTVTITPDATVQEAAQRLDKERAGSLVVVDGPEPVGIVTDRDLAVRSVGRGYDPTSQTVRECMSEPVHTLSEDAGIFDAADAMSERAVRRMPVVDASGELVGIVTLDDMLGIVTSEIALLESVLLAQSKPGSPEGKPI